jgi:hypothetical protein
MIVKASGGVLVHEHDDGRSTYAIRRCRGGRRESVFLGEGRPPHSAATLASLLAALDLSPAAMTAAVRRAGVRSQRERGRRGRRG